MGTGRSRILARLAIVCVAVAASVGCALLVGEPDGHHIFPDIDAAGDKQGDDATNSAPDGEGSEAAFVSETSAPTDGAADAGPIDGPADSGTDAGRGPKCTQQYCAEGEVCCMTDPYDLPDGAACTSSSQCFAPAAFYCTSQHDCVAQGHPNDFCCSPLVYTIHDGSAYQMAQGAQCAASCGAPPVSVLCDPAGGPNECAGFDSGCRLLQFLPGIYYSCH
jgi:hypothetical protein